MKRKIMVFMMASFAFIVLCLNLRVAYAGMQINSQALNIDGSFISEEAVYYIITNPQGQKLGYNPNTKQRYKEFEGGYGTTGIDDIYSVEAYIRPVIGTYTIEMIGNKLMLFSLDISIYREIQSEGLTGFELEGVIDKGLTSKFQFTYNSDPTKPAGIATRIATPSNLKQDITLSRKIGWIDNDGIMNSLLKKAEAIEASITKGKKNTAKNQLNAFINEVNAQKGKHISDKAAKILLEDAQYILDNLNK